MGLGSEWRFKEEDRKSDSCSTESKYKSKLQAKIHKSQKDIMCWLCKKADEIIDHVVSGCSKLAQKEYKRRHYGSNKIVHCNLARNCNLEVGDKWYEHEPKSVLENEDYKILWDFNIQTDHVIEAWRLNFVVVD